MPREDVLSSRHEPDLLKTFSSLAIQSSTESSFSFTFRKENDSNLAPKTCGVTFRFEPRSEFDVSDTEADLDVTQVAFPFAKCKVIPGQPDEKRTDVGREYSFSNLFPLSTDTNPLRVALLYIARTNKKSLRPKRLDSFTKLPEDIILEVFALLDPLDLYHLGSVSKDFHSLIYSTTKIWSTIYRHGQIPKAPVELTNEEWVDLLFGPVICDECHKYTGLPDFAYLKRYCTKCLKRVRHPRNEALSNEIEGITIGSSRSAGWTLWEREAYEMSTDSHLERRIQDISKAKQLLNIPCVYKKQASFLRGSLGRVRKQKLLPSPPPLSQDLRVAELWKLKEQRNERMDVAIATATWCEGIMKNYLTLAHNAYMGQTLHKLMRKLKGQGFLAEDYDGFKTQLDALWFSRRLKGTSHKAWKQFVPEFVESAERRRAQRVRLAKADAKRDAELLARKQALSDSDAKKRNYDLI